LLLEILQEWYTIGYSGEQICYSDSPVQSAAHRLLILAICVHIRFWANGVDGDGMMATLIMRLVVLEMVIIVTEVLR
jgi:hypothetical protein